MATIVKREHRTVREIERPAASELVELRELGVTTVHEAQQQVGLLEAGIDPVVDGSFASGPAVTVLCLPGDSLMVHAAIEVAQPGDVLVITTTEGATTDALLDELIVTECRAHGIAAVVLDAAVRDVAHIRDVGYPVWCRTVHAQGTTKERLGSVNVPVLIGGVTVSPGDAVIADGDGVVVVPRARVTAVLERARERDAADSAARERYALGELSIDVLGLRDRLQEHPG